MSSEIIFIHPPSSMLEKQKMVPPMAQLQLTAVLREAGHESQFLDVGESEVDIDQLSKANYLLFTASTPQYPETLKIVNRIIQEKRKGARSFPILAIGGPHASTMGAGLLKDGWDYVCVGDGEEIITPLVEGKINQGLIVGKRVTNIDDLPIPAYDILDKNVYRRNETYKPTFPVMTSRGCPNDCIFCYKDGRTVRFHSPEYVIGVEKTIKNLGVEQIVKYDDNFTLKPDRVIEICRGIAPLRITWRCNGDTKSLISKKSQELSMLQHMRQAGCELVSIGVDGPDQASLDYLEKGTTIDQCEKAISLVREAGMFAKVYLIYIPGRGLEYTEKLKSFILKNEPDFVQLSVLTPLPGSKIYDNPQKYGLNFDSSKIDGLFYQSRSGVHDGGTGLLNEEDMLALRDIDNFLEKWRVDHSKPIMPV
jgi:radical SAM superfamily enzyme YgiQ (UPF0313 family)